MKKKNGMILWASFFALLMAGLAFALFSLGKLSDQASRERSARTRLEKNKQKKKLENRDVSGNAGQSREMPSENEKTPILSAVEALGRPITEAGDYKLFFKVRENGTIGKTTMAVTGIVSAVEYDLDLDGQLEILVISLPGGEKGDTATSLILSVLEKEGEEWKLASEQPVVCSDRLLYATFCPVRIDAFMGEKNGQAVIYVEGYGRDYLFEKGIFWELQGFSYKEKKIEKVIAPPRVSGSGQDAVACMAMDGSFNNGVEEDTQYVQNFVYEVDQLGLGIYELGWKYPIPDQKQDLKQLVRIEEEANLTESEVEEWLGKENREDLDGVHVRVIDYKFGLEELVN